MKDSKEILKDTIINGSRIYIENGEVKTQLSEEILKTGYMRLEDAKNITIEHIKKIYGWPLKTVFIKTKLPSGEVALISVAIGQMDGNNYF